MQAIGFNGQEFIKFDKDLNTFQSHDLLIEVKAISINPIDSKVKQSVSKDSAPKILGYDGAGIVLSVGDQVSEFKVGDEVFYAGDITRDGSNSSQQLVDGRLVGIKPSSLSFAQAAALPLTSITAWESLFDRLKIRKQDKNKTLLLIGAAGGVGSMAIQFAKKIIGMNVIATASREVSKHWCSELGADIVLDHHDLANQFNQQNLDAPDFILCMGSPDEYLAQMTEVINPQGSICLLVNTANYLDINPLKAKSITLVWEMMFTRSMYQTKDMDQQGQLLNKVSKLVDNDKIKAMVTQSLSPINVENITKAHTLIEQGNMIGKLVLTN